MADHYLQDYYQARAAEYEQIYFRDHPERRAEIAAEVTRLAKLAEGRQVLELACGTGYWTEVLSRTAASLTASDLAPQMLVEAQKKEFAQEVNFIEADMFTADFRRDCFDLVALGFWFSHQPRQSYEQLYDVLVRPLKPNGLIWVIDNNPPAEGSAHRSVGLDDAGNHLQTRKLSDGTEHQIMKNYFTKAELRKLFEPRFEIRSLTHNPYYWSAVLAPK